MEFKRCYGCMRELDAPGAACPHCGYDNTKDPIKQPGHALKCGTILDGQYVVGRSLGQGGFGITYLGYDLKLETPVCIKEYYPEGAAMRSATQSSLVCWGSSENAMSLKESRKSFVREAQKAVKLRNLSHVVSVWSVFYENETAYIVMDYIEGETLKDKLVRTQKLLSEKECVALLAPVMQDLKKAHERGIIHRDIKPDNLMLDTGGDLILLDMGAAKDLDKNAQGVSTLSSALVVSQGFSPMEQYRSKSNIGPWTDVYAMCATIYYCVTGKVLPTPMDRVSGEKIEFGGVSPAFASVLEKGLAIQPEDRIQDMGALLDALTKAVEDPKPLKPSKKKNRLVPVLGVAAALLVAGGVYFGRTALYNHVDVVSGTPAVPVSTPYGKPVSSGTTLSGCVYDVYSDCVMITDFIGNQASLQIPAEIGGKPVTSIGSHAFFNLSTLTDVTVPSSVAVIGEAAFYNCGSLTNVTLNSGVKNIGSLAFSNCHSLTSIVLPNGTTDIGARAFSNCKSLSDVTIPASVQYIGTYAFSNCVSLTDITIPSGVSQIGADAFYNCTSLTEIHAEPGSYAAEYFKNDTRMITDRKKLF